MHEWMTEWMQWMHGMIACVNEQINEGMHEWVN